MLVVCLGVDTYSRLPAQAVALDTPFDRLALRVNLDPQDRLPARI